MKYIYDLSALRICCLALLEPRGGKEGNRVTFQLRPIIACRDRVHNAIAFKPAALLGYARSIPYSHFLLLLWHERVARIHLYIWLKTALHQLLLL